MECKYLDIFKGQVKQNQQGYRSKGEEGSKQNPQSFPNEEDKGNCFGEKISSAVDMLYLRYTISNQKYDSGLQKDVTNMH